MHAGFCVLVEETGEKPAEEVIERELSTGLVITGAYADKLRRTLFAHLKDYVKQDKEVAREVARAAGEINRMLYHILVENLKSEKGDVVRVRVKYKFDPRVKRITWDYDTLTVEFFKRQPDEEVSRVVREVIAQKLKEITELYATPQLAEKAEREFREELKRKEREAVRAEVRVEAPAVAEKPAIPAPETPPVEISLVSLVASADPFGETSEGGVVFKLLDQSGETAGLASLEPRGDVWIIDAIIVAPGRAYRVYAKASRDKQYYLDNPEELVKEIVKAERAIPIPSDDAKKLIEEKMASVI